MGTLSIRDSILAALIINHTVIALVQSLINRAVNGDLPKDKKRKTFVSTN